MGWRRTSTVDHVPADPVGEAVAAAVAEIVRGAAVDLVYAPDGASFPSVPDEPAMAMATGAGPTGWQVRLTVRVTGRIAPVKAPGSEPLLEIVSALPSAGLRAAATFRAISDFGAGAAMAAGDGATGVPLSPALRRSMRDSIVIEALSHHHSCEPARTAMAGLLADTLEFLIELSGTRVESHDLTHGVVITDVLKDEPRLHFRYPADLRAAKRAPLLFDGQRALLIVDRAGRARTELQSHRLNRLTRGEAFLDAYSSELAHSGSLVAEATRRLGGIGFFLRADRTIWIFADGQPLLVRQAEHWSAFPLELAAAIASAVATSPTTADIIVQTAFLISAQRHGAILAIVDDPRSLEGVVSPKDRYDRRDEFDPAAMQTETRLHHLIDTESLDAQTLARLAALDGATILDRQGNLIAYGAIVSSSDSQHEGARTAAATTLSETAQIVLKVSADGDITVFRGGKAVATLLG